MLCGTLLKYSIGDVATAQGNTHGTRQLRDVLGTHPDQDIWLILVMRKPGDRVPEVESEIIHS